MGALLSLPLLAVPSLGTVRRSIETELYTLKDARTSARPSVSSSSAQSGYDMTDLLIFVM